MHPDGASGVAAFCALRPMLRVGYPPRAEQPDPARAGLINIARCYRPGGGRHQSRTSRIPRCGSALGPSMIPLHPSWARADAQRSRAAACQPRSHRGGRRLASDAPAMLRRSFEGTDDARLPSCALATLTQRPPHNDGAVMARAVAGAHMCSARHAQTGCAVCLYPPATAAGAMSFPALGILGACTNVVRTQVHGSLLSGPPPTLPTIGSDTARCGNVGARRDSRQLLGPT